MLVLVNGKVYDSDRVPLMILFSAEEIRVFKSQPDHVDIHCSFPRSWGQEKGRKWMAHNRKTLLSGKGIPLKVITDSDIKKLVEKEKDKSEIPFGELFFVGHENDEGPDVKKDEKRKLK